VSIGASGSGAGGGGGGPVHPLAAATNTTAAPANSWRRVGRGGEFTRSSCQVGEAAAVRPSPVGGAIPWAIATGVHRVISAELPVAVRGPSATLMVTAERIRTGDRVSSAQLTEQLETMVAAAVRGTGLELEELDVSPAGRRRLVRVTVDTPDGSALDLDAVADVSRAVSAVLDDQEGDAVLGGGYTLEVSSPGIDRPLTLPRHWLRARLRLVEVRTTDGAEFVARAGDADDHGVTMLVDGSPRHVAFTEIDRAVVQVEFADPPAAEVAALTSGPTLREESP
jgi:ribosome maturation factor RimP